MEHTCYKCDAELPVRFTYAGPHIKACCGKCNFYIAFVPKTAIPHYSESKNKIWCITQDLELIKSVKLKNGVHDNLKGTDKNMAYHNLYLSILKTFIKTPQT